MPDDKPRRVQVGFAGGQTLTTRMSGEQIASLTDALRSGSGWHDVSTADGTVTVNAAQAVFVSDEDHEQRIGFGG